MDNMELAKVFEEVCIKYRKQIADLETQLKERRLTGTNPFEDAVKAETSQRIIALEQELGAVKMQLQNVIAERDTVEAKRKSVWKKYDNLTAQMEGLRENHRKERDALNDKITSLNKQLDDANMVISNLQSGEQINVKSDTITSKTIHMVW
ncbi:hypothetical protein D5b_00134 [Faustovirus]|nr:hypothetical protein D5b_00134 [Faustovirus]AMN84777.1 hypothetical protein D6_00377 [Faustovirus]AMP44091.1 hypothetical protein PRJ_Dakar_00132 [Faustovirus]